MDTPRLEGLGARVIERDRSLPAPRAPDYDEWQGQKKMQRAAGGHGALKVYRTTPVNVPAGGTLLFRYANVQQLSFQVLLAMEPTVCTPPLTNVPAGKGSAPLSPLPLEVQRIFEKGSVSPLAVGKAGRNGGRDLRRRGRARPWCGRTRRCTAGPGRCSRYSRPSSSAPRCCSLSLPAPCRCRELQRSRTRTPC